MPLADGDFTGEVETEWILATLGALGNVYETEVSDAADLPRSGNLVEPYIVVRFAAPFASAVGRNIATGEQGQPHTLSFTVIVGSGTAEWTRKTMNRVNKALTGKLASNTSSPIKATGGLQYPTPAIGASPMRYQKAQFFRLDINV